MMWVSAFFGCRRNRFKGALLFFVCLFGVLLLNLHWEAFGHSICVVINTIKQFSLTIAEETCQYPATGMKISVMKVTSSLKLKTWRDPSSTVSSGCGLPVSVYPHRVRSLMTDRAATLCQPLQPQTEACQLTEKLFQGPPENCQHQSETEICVIKQIHGSLQFSVMCHDNICHKGIQLGCSTDFDTGQVVWEEMVTVDELRSTLSSVISPVTGSGIMPSTGFCFIRCAGFQSPATQSDGDITETYQQLLVLPPVPSTNIIKSSSHKPLHEMPEGKLSKGAYNLNIIFIDSVSRNHFHRSLPKTVEYFRELNEVDKQPHYTVLDYELVQSVKPRTRESLSVLFGGNIQSDEKPVQLDKLFQPFKAKMYDTLWLDDMCLYSEWGIYNQLVSSDMKLSTDKTYQDLLKEALDKNGIDEIALTEMNCEVYRGLNVSDPFHGPPALCVHGRFHHEYFLDYLQSYQSQRHLFDVPYATVYMTNVAHEHTGRRVQTLDTALYKYLRYITQTQNNTITMIVSDHGNSYGSYPEQTFDGHMEVYHPALFFILPNMLKTTGWSSLIRNQRRFTSLADIFPTLVDIFQLQVPPISPSINLSAGLSDKVGTVGQTLTSPLSAGRGCSDVPILYPAVCICAGSERLIDNDTDHIVLAEFATSQLNEMIQHQYKTGVLEHGSSGVGRCQRLVPYMFTNVRESVGKNGSMTTRMDIHVREYASGTEEIFVVTTSHLLRPNPHNSHKMALKAYDRITSFQKYKSCKEPSVDNQLCVCDTRWQHIQPNAHQEAAPDSDAHQVADNKITTKRNNTFDSIEDSYNNPKYFVFHPPIVFQRLTHIHCVDVYGPQAEKCLYIVYRKQDIGACFEAMNVCVDRAYLVNFYLSGVNVSFSGEMPVTVEVGPLQTYFLATVSQHVMHRGWYWRYEVEYSIQGNSGRK